MVDEVSRHVHTQALEQMQLRYHYRHDYEGQLPTVRLRFEATFYSVTAQRSDMERLAEDLLDTTGTLA
jgi:hypothetical protein